jgi:hypothetical protein
MLKSVSKSLVCATIGAVVALVGSVPARAVPVNVTYGIQYAFFSPAAGVNALQGPGTLTVQFSNGTPGGHVGAGALHVVSGTAMLTNNFSVFGGLIVFTGFQNDVFAGSGMGTVTAGGMFSLMTIGHIASGMLHCAGACSLAMQIASNPVNLTSGPRTINLAAPANVLLGFPSVGPQNFAVAAVAGNTGGMTPNGGAFGVNAVGQEIGRVVVPEPGTGALLGLGLAGFGIAVTTWRARRGRA